jgi:hypothetical protein
MMPCNPTVHHTDCPDEFLHFLAAFDYVGFVVFAQTDVQFAERY